VVGARGNTTQGLMGCNNGLTVLGKPEKQSTAKKFVGDSLVQYLTSSLLTSMARPSKTKAFQSGTGEKKRGGRRGWATPEQDTWLQERLTLYVAAQGIGVKGLAEFWPATFEAWFEKWPEPAPRMLPPPSTQENSMDAPTLESMTKDSIQQRKTVSTIYLTPCFINLCIPADKTMVQQSLARWRKYRWEGEVVRSPREEVQEVAGDAGVLSSVL